MNTSRILTTLILWRTSRELSVTRTHQTLWRINSSASSLKVKSRAYQVSMMMKSVTLNSTASLSVQSITTRIEWKRWSRNDTRLASRISNLHPKVRRSIGTSTRSQSYQTILSPCLCSTMAGRRWSSVEVSSKARNTTKQHLWAYWGLHSSRIEMLKAGTKITWWLRLTKRSILQRMTPVIYKTSSTTWTRRTSSLWMWRIFRTKTLNWRT